MGGNPTNKIDPSGEFGLIGAAVGATLDIGKQALIEGKSFGDINLGEVVVSAAVGAFAPGLLAVGGLAGE